MNAKKLKELIPNHQYVVYSGVSAHDLDLRDESSDYYTTAKFDRADDTTVGEIKTSHPGLYGIIMAKSEPNLSDDCLVQVYEIDNGDQIYVIDDWM